MQSRSVRFSAVFLVLLLLVGMLLLAACGGGSTTTSSAAGSTTTKVVGSPKYGGTLRVAMMSQGANIGWPANLTAGGAFAQSYYETLLHADNKGNLYPWLAESYKIATDMKSITFTIRKGVKFTDGSDLTADVVKWNLDQFLTSQPSWSSVEVVDANTVRVNLKKWDVSVPAAFADSQPGIYMTSKAAYDKNGKDWVITHPVGTGPFIVSSHNMDANAKLVKNPNYWGKDKNGGKLPYLDEIDFTFTADVTTELMMAKNNESDMIINSFAPKDLTDYQKIGWVTHTAWDANEVWVPDSAHADSPWSKLEVREAAEYAIDRATIAKRFGYGFLKAVNQVVPRDSAAYDSNFTLGRTYDPAKAKQLLAQAGYANGFKSKLIVWQGGSRDIALADQQYLAAVGINVELEFADVAKWSQYIGTTGSYHNAILEGPAPSQGPTGLGSVTFSMFLYGNNWQKPAELTSALATATAAATADVKLIRATTDILTKDALIIPIYETGSARVDQSYVVAEFGQRGYPAYCNFEKVWINK